VNDRKVVLIVLDGWGYSSVFEGNAIAQANTPVYGRIWKEYPHALLQASGEAVGLPWGEMGNSEVGHLNIGAGRVVPQDLPRISSSISDGSFFRNKALLAACEHVKATGGALHLIGLASTGGVHSHIRHLFALIKLAATEHVERVFIHIFTDGRDAPTKDALSQIAKLESEIKSAGVGRIASVSGRYYAMDRDKHWDRVKLAFDAIANGTGQTAATAEDAVNAAYAKGLTDEFIEPTVITENGAPVASFSDTDAAIFFNFRPDRTRQLVQTFSQSDFTAFDRASAPTSLYFVTMTQYEKSLPVHVAFHPDNVSDSLAKVISDHGMRQFHVAETEKYPHATFFFNGGYEEPYPLEERILIPSPQVATYNQAPAMSAGSITEELVRRIETADYPFIMVNYANADMVGHSGDFDATRKAVEEVDQCLGRVVDATNRNNYFLVITADHGNAEEMINFTTGEIDTEHTTNPVPFIIIPPDAEKDSFTYRDGKLNHDMSPQPSGLLGDVAPTVLMLYDIEPPEAMRGYGLLT
jgi:2,3-bisphosphoglycerate-independent phosphoglycerate mutase